MLTGDAALASAEAGADAIVRYDVSGQQPVFVGADLASSVTGPVPAGLLNSSMRRDPRWTLAVDGASVVPQPTFGFSQAYEVPAAGTATFEYDTPATRTLWIVLQALLWLILVALAVDVLPRRLGRRSTARSSSIGVGEHSELALTDDWMAPGGEPLFADDPDATKPLRRASDTETGRDRP